MKKVLTTVLLILNFVVVNYAQDLYYLEENFETDNGVWVQSPEIPGRSWKYSPAGQYTGGFFPNYALQGDTIIGLYTSTSEVYRIKLISPRLELGGAVKPTLNFFHSQYSSISTGEIVLYFRSAPSAEWEQIREYTTEAKPWLEKTISIDVEGERFLSDSFQIAFEGAVSKDYGVYLDSITVKEDAILPKFVKSAKYNSLSYSAVAGGATDVPFEELVLRVLGNTGDAVLDSLTVIPNGTGIDELEPNSFKLFYNIDGVYEPFKSDTSALVSTASLVDGKVVFTGINQNLILGDNFFYVTASIKSTLAGQKSLNFSVPANGINVSDTLFPAGLTNFSGNHTLKEAIFYDDFSAGAANWTLDGEFEIGQPEGVVVGGGERNPSSPFNDLNILATDLDGGYAPGVTPGTAYYATSSTFDLTYHIGASLNFQRHYAFFGQDSAVIDISTNNGMSWHNVWYYSPAEGNDSRWTEASIDVSDLVKYQPEVQVRFGIAKTVSEQPGFAVDNFALIAEKLDTDVGVVDIVEPFDDCLDCGNDSVKVWVRNYADGTAPNTIALYYGIWGMDSTLVRDTLYGGIPKDDSVLFVFKTKANFPDGDYYDDFIVGVDLSGDQDPSNDQFQKSLIIQKNETPIVFEDFERKGGIWLSRENSSWMNIDLTGTLPTDPLSPNVWVLSPFGNYRNNDTSWVTSGCYNLKDESRNIIQFKYWSDSEFEKDGARLEYTRDNGTTWEILKDPTYGDSWGWITDTVEALESKGWTGLNNWTTVKALAPIDIDTVEKVKFRMYFMSDDVNANAQGFAFNDFEIFPAPADIGVSKVLAPVDTCQGVNETTVTIRVQNYGYNKLNASDTVIVGVDFESDQPVVDTLILVSDLEPGDSVDFIVNTDIDIATAKTYNITAYTLIEDDPWYYLANNDTAHYSFEVWGNPTILLADTLASKQPDTLNIIPVYPDWVPGYSYLWSPGNISDSIYDISANIYGDTIYKVKVTEPVYGCTSIDSVNVLLLFNDVGVDSILWPVSTCELGVDEIVQIQIRNHGTDSLWAGEEIALYYQVNEGAIQQDTIILTMPLYAGGTIWHSFDEDPFNFSAIGDYKIHAGAYYGGDTVRVNDTISDFITVYGYTPLDIGPDQVVQALDYTLDAGGGFVSYLWNNGETTQTNYLDASVSNVSGTYYVDVLDGNGCAGSDTIDIWFKIRDLRADMLTAPQTACELDRTGDGYVQFRIVNNGSDTVLMTDNITFEYQLDGGSLVSETANPTNPILPGAQYSHTFATSGDFTMVKDYDIDLQVITAGDLRTVNDTTSTVFTTKSNPIIELGEYPDPITSLSFELDAGAGPYTYLWQDGFTTSQTYTATATGYYIVTVTDTETGCVGGDTTLLQFDQLNYSIESISGVSNRICQGESRVILVEVANKGNLPRVDAEITVGYINGSESPVEELFTIDGTWSPGVANSKELTLANAVTFDDEGLIKLKVYVTHPQDLIASDDTLTEDLTIDASPVVDFGGDTLQVSIPYTLDAGDHDSYQWHDNFDGRYYTVTSTDPDLYSVTVTDLNNSCITSKTVWIEPALSIYGQLPDNLSLNLYPNPASEFLNITAEDVTGNELHIEMYSISNQLIWADYHDGFGEYNNKLDLSSFKEGVYLLRFRNKELMHVQRVIIR